MRAVGGRLAILESEITMATLKSSGYSLELDDHELAVVFSALTSVGQKSRKPTRIELDDAAMVAGVIREVLEHTGCCQ